jgi:hypothetical protein
MKRSHHGISHGGRRRWWCPWSLICRCGMGAWPCPVVTMLEHQARHRHPNQRSAWNGPAARNAITPVTVVGQVGRSRQGGRW